MNQWMPPRSLLCFSITRLPVHVGHLDLVIVKEKKLADTAAGQHLGRHTADAADADHRDRVRPDGLK